MKQVQKQTATQRLELTQSMKNSLSLLQMCPMTLCKAAETEARRNPFLKSVPTIPQSASSDYKSSERKQDDIFVHDSPQDALTEQVSVLRLSPKQRQLALDLVHCVDDRGFLTDSADEMCSYLNTKKDELIELVDNLQKSIEPVGVFAWSLENCFKLQLDAKNRYDPLIGKLLFRLDLVADKNIDEICRLWEVDEEDAWDMLNDIRSLSPAPLEPAHDFGSPTHAPDLIFRKIEDEILVELNAQALPAMLTDDALFSTVKTAETDSSALNYYRDCYREAANFVMAMQKRANTLLKIGNVIVDTQSKFIRTDRPLDRNPLTMGKVATIIGLNKSTVSRALKDCSIQTDHGVISSLDYFTRPLNNKGDQRTRDQALQRLSLLIRTENSKAPYSDEKLAEQMARADLKISRRTVAKYRSLLGIKGAHERRISK